MRTIKYSEWRRFKTEFSSDLLKFSGRKNLDNFLFRGQSDPGWSLTSSFDRASNDKRVADDLLESFIDICIKYDYKLELMQSKKEVIGAFAQHYGLPTRLLDWTTSPYFAAFFAFADALNRTSRKDSCVIWAIDKESESLKRRKGLEFVEVPSRFNYRMKNQMGHFTSSTHTEKSIEDFDRVITAETSIDDLLYKIEIKHKDSFEEILKDLEYMGITYSIAYPDIEGFIKEAMAKAKFKK